MEIGFGSWWGVEGGPRVPLPGTLPDGSSADAALVVGRARVVYCDVEDRWWLSECQVLITGPSASRQESGVSLLPIIIRDSEHVVGQVPKDTAA